jgi:hypothetical protein
MTTDRTQATDPVAYRLRLNSSDGVTLQAAYPWVELDDDLNERSGVEWRDVPTFDPRSPDPWTGVPA